MATQDPRECLTLAYAYIGEVGEQIEKIEPSPEFSEDAQVVHDLFKTLDLADEQIERAQSLDPTARLDNLDIEDLRALNLFTRGHVWVHFRSPGNALEPLKKSLAIRENAMVRHWLGVIYTDKRNKDRAIEHLTRAVELEPDEIEYRKALDRAEHMKRSLFKGRVQGQLLGGVCAQLGRRFRVPVWVVRLAFVAVTLLAFPVGLILYGALWVGLAFRILPGDWPT